MDLPARVRTDMHGGEAGIPLDAVCFRVRLRGAPGKGGRRSARRETVAGAVRRGCWTRGAYHGRMMNRWGNDDHGPGGDPSWLGGKDRGSTEPQGSGDWSTDFEADAARPHSDFGGGADVAGSGADGRWGPPSAEEMAPRFGERAGQDARTGGGENSPWRDSFSGEEGSRSERSGASRWMGLVWSLIPFAIFLFIAFRVFDVGFGGWWVFLFIIPVLGRVFRSVTRNLRR